MPNYSNACSTPRSGMANNASEVDMYELVVEGEFSAAHRVRMPDGALEAPHGHDWRVAACFRGASLNQAGFLVDFVEAKQVLDIVTAPLRNGDLNECEILNGMNPTAENLAKAIFDRLAAVPALADTLVGVRVHEAPGCSATYWAEGPQPS